MEDIKLKPEAIRVQLGFTQKEMAKLMGITETTYNLKANGKREWKASELTKLSQLSNIPIGNIKID